MAFPRTRWLPLPALLLAWGCAGGALPIQPPTPAEIPALEARAAERAGDAGVLLRLGAAYREAGRLDDARFTLERAREIDPDHSGVLFYLGLTAEDQVDWSAAGDAYRAFLQTDAEPELLEHIRRRMPLVRRGELMAEARASLAREEELAGTSPPAGTVAVFPFRYQGPDPELEPLGRALAELTVGDLGVTGRLRVLERLRVQLLLDEMALADDGLVDPSTASRSGRLLGAERIVQATLSGDQERVDLLAAVVPVATGVGGEPVSEQDALRALFELQKRMVLALHGSLGIQLTDAERELIMQRPTRSWEALLLYGRALTAEDRGDFDEAEILFEEALVMDPGFERAREGRDRSRDAAAAEQTGSDELASAGQPQIPPGVGGPVDPRDGFRAVESLILDPGGRDPSAELLGNEGIGSSRGVIEIIVRPPGGGQ